MFSKPRRPVKHEHDKQVPIAQEPKNKENPKICLEFLPNGKVMPSVSWEAHSNVDIQLMASVINLVNEGKLYGAFRDAVLHQGVVSGDIELAGALHNNIKDPKSVEDERPLIRAGMVTRLHFSQQGNQDNQGGDE